MTPQQVIDKLVSDADYSQNTEKQYRLLFNKFVGYLDVHQIKLTDATPTVIQTFFDKNDHSRKTQSLYIGLLAQIFDILAESGIELDNPAHAWNQKAKKRRRGKAMQRLPVALTSDEEKRLVETMKQAEIVKPKMGCHILRHTFVTRQFQAGIQPATIKAWIGHSDLTVTFKVYEHVASAPAGVRPA